LNSTLSGRRILYVSTVWTGLREALFEGAVEPRGMPAFLRPLQALIECGAEVSLLLVHPGPLPPTRMALGWMQMVRLLEPLDWKSGLVGRLTNPLRLAQAVESVLRANSFEFVYVHGPSLATAVGAARRHKVLVGHRIYGTMFLRQIQRHGKWGAVIRQPLEYLTFRQKRTFLLATDDGSGADKVHQTLQGETATFFHWHNGVDVPPEPAASVADTLDVGSSKRPFLAYVARLDRWKRQDLALELVAELARRGTNVHLLLAGQVHSPDWLEELKNRAQGLGISAQVHYLGVVDAAQRTWLFREATASLTLYDVSNLGNVFHEMLAAGALILARNDGSLDHFLVDGKNGYLVDTMEQAADHVVEVLANPAVGMGLRGHAREVSTRLMVPWAERATLELRLISDAIEGKC